MGYSKHELGTMNMLYYLKKIHTTSLPPQDGYLFTMAAFFCPQGGHCGEVRLYYQNWT